MEGEGCDERKFVDNQQVGGPLAPTHPESEAERKYSRVSPMFIRKVFLSLKLLTSLLKTKH